MVCGTGNCDDGYIDLGVWYEFVGTCYICMNCIHQAAEVAGCLLPVEAATIRAAAERIGDQNTDLAKENEILRERLSIFDAAVRSAAATNDSTRSVLDSPVNSGNDSTTSSDGSVQPAITAGEPESKESVTEPRLTDTSESTESDGKSAKRVQFDL
jgi:hypothetical protein